MIRYTSSITFEALNIVGLSIKVHCKNQAT